MAIIAATSLLLLLPLKAASSSKISAVTHTKLKYYISQTIKLAQEHQLKPALILAIIHQESRFNADALSSANAIGLMQIKANTAGIDVSKAIVGKPVELAEKYLFKPDKNLAVGTYYLKLLEDKYLAKIENNDVKRLAVIAAYNGGIGTLQRFIDSDWNTFINRLNKLKYDELYRELTESHPFEETRDYVKKVERHYHHYSQLLETHNLK